MNLRHTDNLESYIWDFEKAKYGVAVHNLSFDELFYVTHFVRGLKLEIQNVVQVQVPVTVDSAILLAQIQQEILDRNRFKVQKQPLNSKVQNLQPRMKNKGVLPAVDLSKERQVSEYRRLNGLCYACGEKFEPRHLAKCTKRGNIQLNVVETEEVHMVLTDEVLQQLEQVDEQGETCCHVLFQAVAGNAKGNSMRIRATVGKRVMVMLIDSGSSTDFISEHMV